jgi:hypothetical protein
VTELVNARKRAEQSQKADNWVEARQALEELDAEAQVLLDIDEQLGDVLKRYTKLPQKNDREAVKVPYEQARAKFKGGDIPGGLTDLVTCVGLVDGI